MIYDLYAESVYYMHIEHTSNLKELPFILSILKHNCICTDYSLNIFGNEFSSLKPYHLVFNNSSIIFITKNRKNVILIESRYC